MMIPTPSQKVWVITGASSGLGRELVVSALSRGDKVVATARCVDGLIPLQASHPEHCTLLQLDVTDAFERISAVAHAAISVWGRVDVLVNNAGYGLFSTVEEAGVEGFMRMYQTHIFGVVNVTNAFLPHMRQRRSGTVVIIGSRSAWHMRFPTASLYGSSKAAVHAIADALSVELRPHGIRVLNVVPGALRTLAIPNSIFVSNRTLPHPTPSLAAGEVPEYATLRATAQDVLQRTSGAENGCAKKAAHVIMDVVRDEGVAKGRPFPDSLYLGSDALRDVGAKCAAVLKRLHDWEDVARSIDICP